LSQQPATDSRRCSLIHKAIISALIFPEGRAQPTYTGLITTTDGKQWKVLQRKRPAGCAVHYASVKSTTADVTLTFFEAGATMVAGLSAKDFER